MFSFSTCWNSDASMDGEAMIHEIQDLGFDQLELSHGIRMSLLEGIERALKGDSRIRISSVHNFCPLPVGYLHSNPNIYLLSSINEKERQRAIRQTVMTMDFAVKVKAPYVVMHLGRVEMGQVTGKLVELARDGKRDSPSYRKILEKALKRRKKDSSYYMQRVMNSLEVLVKEADQRKLVLCIEFRHELEEIPNEYEFEQIFQTFGPENLAYWHDCGHAQTQHNLGLIDQWIWLEKVQNRLVGGHVHDLTYPDHDHRVIGKGMIEFERLTPLRDPKKLKVFEFSPRTPADVLKETLKPFMARFEEIQGV